VNSTVSRWLQKQDDDEDSERHFVSSSAQMNGNKIKSLDIHPTGHW